MSMLKKNYCIIIRFDCVTHLAYRYFCFMQVFRKGLTKMFLSQGDDVVFMETAMHLKHHPHMYIECVPMPKEVGDMAPIYFKVISL